jgi:large subunit ribosomal protein L30
MGIKVTLVKSHSGASERQVATIVGLGLKKFGSQRLLKDTPMIRGMISKVRHLVHHEIVKEEPKPRTRRKPRAIRLRDVARSKAATAAK